MTTRKLDKREWRPFLDGISKLLEGKQAQIEVVCLCLGDQVQIVKLRDQLLLPAAT